MATEEYQVGYEAGYQDGWNAAQKPFVGLTNQELVDLTSIYSGAPLYCAIEAMLREKNT